MRETELTHHKEEREAPSLMLEQHLSGVVNGQLEVKNLSLRPSLLEEDYSLPFRIRQSHVGQLRLKIPWNLFSPIELEVQDVLAIIECVPEDQWDSSTASSREQARRDKHLKKLIDRRRGKGGGDSTAAGVGGGILGAFVKHQLGSWLFNRIHITVTNVHIRYEDAHSGVFAFAAGVVLPELTLHRLSLSESLSRPPNTTDATPDKQKSLRVVTAVYWTSCERMFLADHPQWEQELHQSTRHVQHAASSLSSSRPHVSDLSSPVPPPPFPSTHHPPPRTLYPPSFSSGREGQRYLTGPPIAHRDGQRRVYGGLRLPWHGKAARENVYGYQYGGEGHLRMAYVLPPTSLSMEFASPCPKTGAMLSIVGHIPPVSVTVDQLILQDIHSLQDHTNAWQAFQRHCFESPWRFGVLRPSVPAHTDPRAWWRYAFRCLRLCRWEANPMAYWYTPPIVTLLKWHRTYLMLLRRKIYQGSSMSEADEYRLTCWESSLCVPFKLLDIWRRQVLGDPSVPPEDLALLEGKRPFSSSTPFAPAHPSQDQHEPFDHDLTSELIEGVHFTSTRVSRHSHKMQQGRENRALEKGWGVKKEDVKNFLSGLFGSQAAALGEEELEKTTAELQTVVGNASGQPAVLSSFEALDVCFTLSCPSIQIVLVEVASRAAFATPPEGYLAFPFARAHPDCLTPSVQRQQTSTSLPHRTWRHPDSRPLGRHAFEMHLKAIQISGTKRAIEGSTGGLRAQGSIGDAYVGAVGLPDDCPTDQFSFVPVVGAKGEEGGRRICMVKDGMGGGDAVCEDDLYRHWSDALLWASLPLTNKRLTEVPLPADPHTGRRKDSGVSCFVSVDVDESVLVKVRGPVVQMARSSVMALKFFADHASLPSEALMMDKSYRQVIPALPVTSPSRPQASSRVVHQDVRLEVHHGCAVLQGSGDVVPRGGSERAGVSVMDVPAAVVEADVIIVTVERDATSLRGKIGSQSPGSVARHIHTLVRLAAIEMGIYTWHALADWYNFGRPWSKNESTAHTFSKYRQRVDHVLAMPTTSGKSTPPPSDSSLPESPPLSAVAALSLSPGSSPSLPPSSIPPSEGDSPVLFFPLFRGSAEITMALLAEKDPYAHLTLIDQSVRVAVRGGQLAIGDVPLGLVGSILDGFDVILPSRGPLMKSGWLAVDSGDDTRRQDDRQGGMMAGLRLPALSLRHTSSPATRELYWAEVCALSRGGNQKGAPCIYLYAFPSSSLPARVLQPTSVSIVGPAARVDPEGPPRELRFECLEQDGQRDRFRTVEPVGASSWVRTWQLAPPCLLPTVLRRQDAPHWHRSIHARVLCDKLILQLVKDLQPSIEIRLFGLGLDLASSATQGTSVRALMRDFLIEDVGFPQHDRRRFMGGRRSFHDGKKGQLPLLAPSLLPFALPSSPSPVPSHSRGKGVRVGGFVLDMDMNVDTMQGAVTLQPIALSLTPLTVRHVCVCVTAMAERPLQSAFVRDVQLYLPPKQIVPREPLPHVLVGMRRHSMVTVRVERVHFICLQTLGFTQQGLEIAGVDVGDLMLRKGSKGWLVQIGTLRVNGPEILPFFLSHTSPHAPSSPQTPPSTTKSLIFAAPSHFAVDEEPQSGKWVGHSSLVSSSAAPIGKRSTAVSGPWIDVRCGTDTAALSSLAELVSRERDGELGQQTLATNKEEGGSDASYYHSEPRGHELSVRVAPSNLVVQMRLLAPLMDYISDIKNGLTFLELPDAPPPTARVHVPPPPSPSPLPTPGRGHALDEDMESKIAAGVLRFVAERGRNEKGDETTDGDEEQADGAKGGAEGDKGIHESQPRSHESSHGDEPVWLVSLDVHLPVVHVPSADHPVVARGDDGTSGAQQATFAYCYNPYGRRIVLRTGVVSVSYSIKESLTFPPFPLPPPPLHSSTGPIPDPSPFTLLGCIHRATWTGCSIDLVHPLTLLQSDTADQPNVQNVRQNISSEIRVELGLWEGYGSGIDGLDLVRYASCDVGTVRFCVSPHVLGVLRSALRGASRLPLLPPHMPLQPRTAAMKSGAVRGPSPSTARSSASLVRWSLIRGAAGQAGKRLPGPRFLAHVTLEGIKAQVCDSGRSGVLEGQLTDVDILVVTPQPSLWSEDPVDNGSGRVPLLPLLSNTESTYCRASVGHFGVDEAVIGVSQSQSQLPVLRFKSDGNQENGHVLTIEAGLRHDAPIRCIAWDASRQDRLEMSDESTVTRVTAVNVGAPDIHIRPTMLQSVLRVQREAASMMQDQPDATGQSGDRHASLVDEISKGMYYAGQQIGPRAQWLAQRYRQYFDVIKNQPTQHEPRSSPPSPSNSRHKAAPPLPTPFQDDDLLSLIGVSAGAVLMCLIVDRLEVCCPSVGLTCHLINGATMTATVEGLNMESSGQTVIVQRSPQGTSAKEKADIEVCSAMSASLSSIHIHRATPETSDCPFPLLRPFPASIHLSVSLPLPRPFPLPTHAGAAPPPLLPPSAPEPAAQWDGSMPTETQQGRQKWDAGDVCEGHLRPMIKGDVRAGPVVLRVGYRDAKRLADMLEAIKNAGDTGQDDFGTGEQDGKRHLFCYGTHDDGIRQEEMGRWEHVWPLRDISTTGDRRQGSSTGTSPTLMPRHSVEASAYRQAMSHSPFFHPLWKYRNSVRLDDTMEAYWTQQVSKAASMQDTRKAALERARKRECVAPLPPLSLASLASVVKHSCTFAALASTAIRHPSDLRVEFPSVDVGMHFGEVDVVLWNDIKPLVRPKPLLKLVMGPSSVTIASQLTSHPPEAAVTIETATNVSASICASPLRVWEPLAEPVAVGLSAQHKMGLPASQGDSGGASAQTDVRVDVKGPVLLCVSTAQLMALRSIVADLSQDWRSKTLPSPHSPPSSLSSTDGRIILASQAAKWGNRGTRVVTQWEPRWIANVLQQQHLQLAAFMSAVKQETGAKRGARLWKVVRRRLPEIIGKGHRDAMMRFRGVGQITQAILRDYPVIILNRTGLPVRIRLIWRPGQRTWVEGHFDDEPGDSIYELPRLDGQEGRERQRGSYHIAAGTDCGIPPSVYDDDTLVDVHFKHPHSSVADETYLASIRGVDLAPLLLPSPRATILPTSPPSTVMLTVNLSETGRRIVRLASPLQVVNVTPLPLTVRALKPTSHVGASEVAFEFPLVPEGGGGGVLPAYETSVTSIQLRAGALWSAAFGLTAVAELIRASSMPGAAAHDQGYQEADKTYRGFVVITDDNGTAHTVLVTAAVESAMVRLASGSVHPPSFAPVPLFRTVLSLKPPVRVNNSLPVPVRFRLGGSPSDTYMSSAAFLRPFHSVPVFSHSTGRDICVSVAVYDLPWSEPRCVWTGTHDTPFNALREVDSSPHVQEDEIPLQGTCGRLCSVAIETTSGQIEAAEDVTLTIRAPFWLVSRLYEPLAFAVPSSSPPTSACDGGRGKASRGLLDASALTASQGSRAGTATFDLELDSTRDWPHIVDTPGLRWLGGRAPFLTHSPKLSVAVWDVPLHMWCPPPTYAHLNLADLQTNMTTANATFKSGSSSRRMVPIRVGRFDVIASTRRVDLGVGGQQRSASSTLVEFRPRFLLYNYTGWELEVKQDLAYIPPPLTTTHLRPGECQPFHFINADVDYALAIRVASIPPFLRNRACTGACRRAASQSTTEQGHEPFMGLRNAAGSEAEKGPVKKDRKVGRWFTRRQGEEGSTKAASGAASPAVRASAGPPPMLNKDVLGFLCCVERRAGDGREGDGAQRHGGTGDCRCVYECVWTEGLSILTPTERTMPLWGPRPPPKTDARQRSGGQPADEAATASPFAWLDAMLSHLYSCTAARVRGGAQEGEGQAGNHSGIPALLSAVRAEIVTSGSDGVSHVFFMPADRPDIQIENHLSQEAVLIRQYGQTLSEEYSMLPSLEAMPFWWPHPRTIPTYGEYLEVRVPTCEDDWLILDPKQLLADTTANDDMTATESHPHMKTYDGRSIYIRCRSEGSTIVISLTDFDPRNPTGMKAHSGHLNHAPATLPTGRHDFIPVAVKRSRRVNVFLPSVSFSAVGLTCELFHLRVSGISLATFMANHPQKSMVFRGTIVRCQLDHQWTAPSPDLEPLQPGSPLDDSGAHGAVFPVLLAPARATDPDRPLVEFSLGKSYCTHDEALELSLAQHFRRSTQVLGSALGSSTNIMPSPRRKPMATVEGAGDSRHGGALSVTPCVDYRSERLFEWDIVGFADREVGRGGVGDGGVTFFGNPAVNHFDFIKVAVGDLAIKLHGVSLIRSVKPSYVALTSIGSPKPYGGSSFDSISESFPLSPPTSTRTPLYFQTLHFGDSRIRLTTCLKEVTQVLSDASSSWWSEGVAGRLVSWAMGLADLSDFELSLQGLRLRHLFILNQSLASRCMEHYVQQLITHAPIHLAKSTTTFLGDTVGRVSTSISRLWNPNAGVQHLESRMRYPRLVLGPARCVTGLNDEASLICEKLSGARAAEACCLAYLVAGPKLLILLTTELLVIDGFRSSTPTLVARIPWFPHLYSLSVRHLERQAGPQHSILSLLSSEVLWDMGWIRRASSSQVEVLLGPPLPVAMDQAETFSALTHCRVSWQCARPFCSALIWYLYRHINV
ncbi:unnamed protein product [Vitrella brassicaformis CCMP3155]|uniref:C2 domain-containing protein n=5 Tax=Vitrella brassicaformis TaxID=1169539 RepID=A0A0G4EKT7_VITBC|nr:unnamed protein product [Vitrella brassicaformis CCMP3155]|eukprot:CEL97115.1 unnamed protein product [Vitrella brassicaformis CCMP3155]